MRIVILLVLASLILGGCCGLCLDKAEENACLKFWYGLEPDTQNPAVYKNGLEIWKDEAFGPSSGWQKTMVKLFGSPAEKELLEQQIRNEAAPKNPTYQVK
jgi:hypothetical protein